MCKRALKLFVLVFCGVVGFGWSAEFVQAGAKLGQQVSKGSQSVRAENIALGKPYTLSPRPNYQYCTDPGDRTQLTDGKTTTSYFWTQKGTVGWRNSRLVIITLDLKRVEPIEGVALVTAAGRAGVNWPLAIHVQVSEDGKNYFEAGELIKLDHEEHGPWPKEYAIRKLETHRLKARGRFVRFVVYTPAEGASYFFTDEIEVYRGPKRWLREPLHLKNALAPQAIRLTFSVQKRWQKDCSAFKQLLSEAEQKVASGKGKDAKLQTLHQLQQELAKLSSSELKEVREPDTFRAVLPLGETHARLFALQARLWRLWGVKPLAARAVCPWSPLDLFTLSPLELTRETSQGDNLVRVDTMLGEFRAGAVNVVNSTERPVKLRVWFEGLPQSPTPAYVTVHQVEWTDTSHFEPVASALPEAARGDRCWLVTVLPGLVRQVWLSFHVERLQP